MRIFDKIQHISVNYKKITNNEFSIIGIDYYRTFDNMRIVIEFSITNLSKGEGYVFQRKSRDGKEEHERCRSL